MPPVCEELLLTSFADALSRLAGATIAIDVLAPKYPCAGKGALRVVRVTPEPEPSARYRLVVTYDDYVRL